MTRRAEGKNFALLSHSIFKGTRIGERNGRGEDSRRRKSLPGWVACMPASLVNLTSLLGR